MISRAIALTLLAASLLVFTGCVCSCPEAPSLQRYADASFATPDGCLEYLRKAVMRKDAYHFVICFSRSFRAQYPDLTEGNVHSFWSDVENVIKRRVGDIDEIEVDEPEFEGPNGNIAKVIVASSKLSKEVTLVREYYCVVRWTDGGVTFVSVPEAGDSPVSLEEQSLLLQLGVKQALMETPEYIAADVYTVAYEYGWRIRSWPGMQEELGRIDTSKAP